MNDSARICQTATCLVRTRMASSEGRRHLDVLRAEQQLPAIVAIGDDAAEHREEQDRQLAEEVVEPQVERGLRQLEDQPALRHLLHPRADGRGEGAEPEHREIAISEGGEGAVQEGGAKGRRRRWIERLTPSFRAAWTRNPYLNIQFFQHLHGWDEWRLIPATAARLYSLPLAKIKRNSSLRPCLPSPISNRCCAPASSTSR